MDTVDTETRSRIMSRIRSKDTGPERRLKAILRAAGIRYRSRPRMRGSPDLRVLGDGKVVVFVDGCFWHACPDHFRMPSSNIPFWSGKIWRNVERDRHVTALLRSRGWRVIRLWEHELRDPAAAAAKVLGSRA